MFRNFSSKVLVEVKKKLGLLDRVWPQLNVITDQGHCCKRNLKMLSLREMAHTCSFYVLVSQLVFKPPQFPLDVSVTLLSSGLLLHYTEPQFLFLLFGIYI